MTDQWVTHETEQVVVAGFAPSEKPGARDLYIVEPVGHDEVPADRLAYWESQTVKDRGGATELFIATKRTTTVIERTPS